MRVRTSRTAWLIAAAAAVGMVTAACGGNSRAGRSAGPTRSGIVVPNVQQGTGGYVFTPSAVSVPSGGKIVVSNNSLLQHTFTIAGTDIDLVNDPGQFQTVTVSLDAGTYPFVWRFHQALGMKGTLTVTS
jgi:plastocyanin